VKGWTVEILVALSGASVTWARDCAHFLRGRPLTVVFTSTFHEHCGLASDARDLRSSLRYLEN
jgi:hypothetical protein